MTTTPAPPTLGTTLTSDLAWVKTHVILLIFVVLLAFGLFYETQSVIAKHDAAKAAEYQTSLNTAVQATKDIQNQAAAQDAQLVKLIQSLTTQNQQLATQVSSRDKVTQQAQQKAATLDATDTAAAIAVETKASTGAVVAQDNTIVLALPIARTINEDLLSLAQAQADLADTQKQLVNEEVIANQTQLDLDEQKKLVLAQQKELSAGQKNYEQQIDALKAASLKGKIKWFGIGYIAGFISGATAHLW
jgi:hypothetical protein